MEQLTALEAPQILTLIQTSKADRQTFINQIMDEVMAGIRNPLDLYVHIKAFEDIIFRLTSLDEKKNAHNIEQARIFRNLLKDEAGKYDGKSFEYGNAKIEKKEVGVKYDYSVCNDPTLNDLLSQQAALDEQVKARQKMLQNVPEKGQIMTDEDTGETTTVYRPAKTSTTTIAVTLK